VETLLWSRLAAIVALVGFFAVSFSAQAGWFPTPVELIPELPPEPAPLLLIGVALTAAGWFLRATQITVDPSQQ